MFLAVLILVGSSTEVVADEPRAVVVETSPMGTRSARPLVAGYALSARATGSLLDTPLGLVGTDLAGALALTSSVDIFAGARLSLGLDANTNTATRSNVIPYIGARYGGSFNGRTFFAIELAVSAAFVMPRLNNVTWIVEPSGLVSFTPTSWLELTAAVHAMSVPQTTLWGVGPGFGSAFRVSDTWSLLLEVKTLLMHTAQNTVALAPTLSLGAAFH